ncbi:hypothetical protein QRD02_12790 [Aequorivita sp. SDUM287046]|uniref:Uncharacterized protein n=1 Tax=Aequorivita aurantiaca TaxID=3053356 RepID=A0ABT8DPT5_9FLAO|nr:hypothetical protein [Aequorivita aurantiaca]MDN3725258.1 hypothetical protein [Aequorivita aurantiaca]
MSQSVFYIPSEFVVAGIQDAISITIDDYTNQLLYLAKNRRSKPLENPEAFENIIKKRFQLDKTVSYLIKQKNILDDRSFSYLLEKYMDQINLACYGSKVLYDNVKERFPNEPLMVYNTFLVQQNTIQEHRNELISRLDIANNQLSSLDDVLQMSLMQNPAFKELLSLQEKELQPIALQTHPTNGVALISDEEAQHFLLETVFSIPLDEI